jgi:hypothetical protein
MRDQRNNSVVVEEAHGFTDWPENPPGLRVNNRHGFSSYATNVSLLFFTNIGRLILFG